MNWHAYAPIIRMRNIGRRLGVNRILSRWISRRGYEERYDRELAKCVRQGDVVWDIGANVGFYTKQFAQRVGESGTVYAFEPSPTNYENLCSACEQLANVTPLRFGLGARNGTVGFVQGTDSLGATSRVVDDASISNQISIKTGETVLDEQIAHTPNVIKIDVEGRELEVVAGLHGLLKKETLRAVGVEIHFRLLHELGCTDAPAEIVRVLKEAGFYVSWPDPSHLLGVKKTPQ